ncbi:hypothetical protein FHR83_005561 [Actinoplanes campanulatus]|uniref:Uncharacterized protein n=1 Tax=Actinoplanes campanulatus TaxID=113559 RepID=A0A7W5AKE0_9ACTN|nr:Trp biosynthesis-associated membrane protein [Actinoplanes campanulatus]MBB3097877.1 hypothetical protein [Actinoplanes campanulatus]GGN22456.1 hypothetical protein GCM10010109_37060 [Actinoplanes campanulatus]GID34566.1 hypothetical protein Aca09nite_10720 [Actinoplanes campanulatus]
MNLLFTIAKNRWAALIIGLVLIPLGLLNATSTDQVTCGGQVMQEGDICETSRRGSTTERSYDEQKENDVTGSYILAGVGGVLVLVGATQFVLRARRRSADATTADAPATAA